MDATKINRFCELVAEINELNRFIAEKRADFYSGGFTFEEVFGESLMDLEKNQIELNRILISITN